MVIKEANQEADRIAALYRYGILDTPPDAALDRITSIASTICETPIALITLLDQNKQWFKSRIGIDETETSRDIAFCSHAITNPEQLTEITDATKDARFSDNPLVTGKPNIRFYAGKPLLTPDGYALGTLCVISDKPKSLTPRQRASLDDLADMVMLLLEERQNSSISIIGRAIENKISSGIIITDPNITGTPITYCNRGFEKLTGYISDEVIGQSCFFLRGPKTDPATLHSIGQALENKQSITAVVQAYRKDDSTFWMEFTLSPVLDDAGTVRYFLGFLEDISSRMEAQLHIAKNHRKLQITLDDRTRLTKQLASAKSAIQCEIAQRKHIENESKKIQNDMAHLARITTMGELATGLAHEINQPLQAISQCADMAVMITKPDTIVHPDLIECLEDIQDETQRVGNIIRAMRQFIKREESNRERVNINELIRQTVSLIRNDSHKLGIEVNLIERKVPEPLIDRVQIAQVLANLLRNSIEAIDALPYTSNKSAGSINVETHTANDEIIISVSDTGAGFPDNIEPFKAFETSKNNGLGIGLSISRSIMEAHQGNLWLDKSYTNGCRMAIKLPIDKVKSNSNITSLASPEFS